MRTKTSVEITRLNEAVCMGYLGRMSIAVWRNSPDEAVAWFEEELKTGIARFGSGLGHMPVLEPCMPPWSTEARRGLMDIVRKYEKELDVVIPIVGGTGFAGAAVRAMGAGMLLFVPNIRVKIKMVGSVEDAGEMAGKHLPDHQPPLTASSIADAVNTMREQWEAAHRVPAE